MSVSTPYQLARQYQRTQAETASPTQLVLMLYDGAIRFLSLAVEKMKAKDLEARHTYLLKAQRILSELLSSLDREKGGEIADNLNRLYLYMLQQLVEANLRDTPEPIEHVIGLLRELRESWAEVDRVQQKAARTGTPHGA